jgi:hypothetical protein
MFYSNKLQNTAPNDNSVAPLSEAQEAMMLVLMMIITVK